jgi:hypothetical protein
LDAETILEERVAVSWGRAMAGCRQDAPSVHDRDPEEVREVEEQEVLAGSGAGRSGQNVH